MKFVKSVILMPRFYCGLGSPMITSSPPGPGPGCGWGAGVVGAGGVGAGAGLVPALAPGDAEALGYFAPVVLSEVGLFGAVLGALGPPVPPD